jgi:hypothetical protein
MKKIFTFLVIASLMVSNVQGQTRGTDGSKDYVLRTLTFEDKDYKGTGSNAQTYWSDLIPVSEYGNGNGRNSWYDENNTELSFFPSTTALYPGYGGHAISCYVGNDLEQCGNYMYDIQAYNVKGGSNSSKNFCVHFGYLDDSDMGMMNELVYFEFGDGKERVIDHMYVTNTTYVYNILENGDGWMVPVGGVSDDCWFKIVAYGYNLNDELTGVAEFALWENGTGIKDWTKWELSSLGKVARVEFNMIGSEELYASGYGLGAPGYFAYDNVAVRFDKNTDTGIESAYGCDEIKVMYDLQGRRMTRPTKGIFIKNGRKVVMTR